MVVVRNRSGLRGGRRRRTARASDRRAGLGGLRSGFRRHREPDRAADLRVPPVPGRPAPELPMAMGGPCRRGGARPGAARGSLPPRPAGSDRRHPGGGGWGRAAGFVRGRPAGRLPSYRWRWVARAAVAGPVLALLEAPFIHDREDPTADTPWLVGGTAGRYLYEVALVTVYGLFGIALAAMFSLVLRFRRAGAVERRQLTWFLYAAVVNAVVLVLDSVLRLLPPTLVTAAASAAAFALLPVAVGIAMLRYRLFEIDRIVSRTVSYGLLTGCLVVLYLVLVALL